MSNRFSNEYTILGTYEIVSEDPKFSRAGGFLFLFNEGLCVYLT